MVDLCQPAPVGCNEAQFSRTIRIFGLGKREVDPIQHVTGLVGGLSVGNALEHASEIGLLDREGAIIRKFRKRRKFIPTYAHDLEKRTTRSDFNLVVGRSLNFHIAVGKLFDDSRQTFDRQGNRSCLLDIRLNPSTNSKI